MAYYYISNTGILSKRIAFRSQIPKTATFMANTKWECVEFIKKHMNSKAQEQIEPKIQESEDINDLSYPDMDFASGYGYSIPKMAIKKVRKYNKKIKTQSKKVTDFINVPGMVRQTKLNFNIGCNIVKKAIPSKNTVFFNDAGYSQFMQWKQDVVESKLNHQIWNL